MYTIPLDDDSEATLSDEWLTPQEREEKECAQVRQVQLRARSQPDPTNSPLALTNSASTPASNPDAPITLAEHERQHDIGVANAIQKNGPQMCAANSRRGEPRYVDAVEHVADLPPEVPTDHTQTTTFTPQRSTRPMKGQRTETLFQNEVFEASLNNPTASHQDQLLSYHAALQTDHETGEFNGSDPRAYAASHKLNDPGMPSVHNALHGESSHQYI